ncbi:MAG TPA: Nudix family hydrolase [Methylomicrobium sp.]|nr:Nudix family hydrolase [Methylomicrobium sp.]
MPNIELNGSNALQVAVGVVTNDAGRILIARRHEASHQGGFWEFPGGKIEAGETPEEALFRELKEELDINVIESSPLITVNHRYSDFSVILRVFLVEQFTGTAQGCQGQPIRWVDRSDLGGFSFPAANRPIVKAALLPPYYAILDDHVSSDLLADLHKLLAKGIKLIQARLKATSSDRVKKFLMKAGPFCSDHNAILLINSAVDCGKSETHSIHLTSSDLLALQKRPSKCLWVGASCHNLKELEHAQKIDVDFVVLAPVLPTQTHQDMESLGWNEFAALTAQMNIPVYAMGGMKLEDLNMARSKGAQGIAGIRAFLD